MKKILLIGICVLLGIGAVDANLSDGFFCQVKSEEVVISLKKTEGFYRCKDTIVSLESLIVDAFNDLRVIDVYIDRGRDMEYWIAIKIEQLSMLDRLHTVRQNIIDSMQSFEHNLVEKSIHYFIISITSYKVGLQKSLMSIYAMTGTHTSSLLSYVAMVKEQITVIEYLSQVRTIEELVPLFNRYLYLKKHISGRYE